ncbi:NAD-dependent dehydratase [Microvirga sp. KLBC 81]|uniref:SDR family oxidoreductase n=1 Tax=Microvirga sp. KLBC 81 TaxID=1862707 RepID=UPI000D50C6D6|nr:SDR family oxidoreductase [Microvirga sp. KLBC 81]PVE22986.1 NAD-dependent dehydratase [Microvirga sp. KLBC 81]
MVRRSALVVGPTGAIGTSLVAAMARQGDWAIYGVSRSAPLQESGFVHLAADLLDGGSVRRAISQAGPITHVFYAARAPHGEGGIEDVEPNVRMLANVVEAAEAHSSELTHVHLVEGTKWYGVHLGPHRTPTQEDDPRHMPPNFYYDQEDALTALQGGKRWTWSACRPNVVCDFAPSRARNLTTIIAAYAAICRELSVPFDFPGTALGYDTLTEVTDGNHLAEAILWLSTRPEGTNRAFNITNGDAFRWRYMWPRLADMLSVKCGEPRDIRLASWMQDKGPVWDRIVARCGLQRRPLGSVALWAFGDFVFRQDWDLLSSLTRLRQTGFAGSVDSAQMFQKQFEDYRRAGILPGRE